ncbi:glycosyl hydrolase family 76-domain-containing protein [Massariosphaeria phaeospora]|uniref:Mannan endo-1,6-alpha-mannosidase n=1 Tax=Massariosphaeria phaeospora TaxID=100035 RepID=A0A7C8I3X9_9PLEO|nr:glycosyl hydrolase family 76-domain-containing protein [Massariosphaeria phaeospora]
MLSIFLFAFCVSSFLLPVTAQVASPAATLGFDDATNVMGLSRQFAESIINEYYKKNPLGSSTGLFYTKPEPLGGSELPWNVSANIWDTLITYSNLTGDTQFSDLISEALFAQADSPDDTSSFMPRNQTLYLDNPAQAQWGLAALSAAESNLVPSRRNQRPYFQLADEVFSAQTERWNSSLCNGILRHSIFLFNEGYDQSSALGMSSFFLLSARLARFSGNQTYITWAEKAFASAQKVGFISDKYQVFDRADIVDEKCVLDKSSSTSSNLGRWIEGTAVLYNQTNGNETWRTHLTSLLNTTSQFLLTSNASAPLIASDCKADNALPDCGIHARLPYIHSLSRIVALAPFTAAKLNPMLAWTADAAMSVCTMISSSIQTNGQELEFDFAKACPNDWSSKNSVNTSDPLDLTVVTAATALESLQGLLWAMERQVPQKTGEGNGQNANPDSKQGGAVHVLSTKLSIAVGGLAMVAMALVL